MTRRRREYLSMAEAKAEYMARQLAGVVAAIRRHVGLPTSAPDAEDDRPSGKSPDRLDLFREGIVSMPGADEGLRYLYLNPVTEPHVHNRELELRRSFLRYLGELGVTAPVSVRLVRRVGGRAWLDAPPSQRLSTSDHEIIGQVRVTGHAGRAHVSLSIQDDLDAGATTNYVLAHEARHAWQHLAAPEHRRHELTTARQREIDADAWAREALARSGTRIPARFENRDLSNYRG